MFAVEHRVRVFVFQILEHGAEFLLLRRRPREEWPLGPAIGEVGLHEHIRDAVMREVRSETGLKTAHHVFDLAQPAKELFGRDDEATGLVEWPVAYQAGTPVEPVRRVRPGPEVGEFRWMGFEEAYEQVESPHDREALIRLRLELHG